QRLKEKLTMKHERLKETRKEKKLSQEFMAKKLGISRQGYGHYETGRNEPDNESLLKIAEILDCQVDYLLGYKIKEKESPYLTDQLHAFSFRLRQGLKDFRLSIDEVATECNVTS